MMQKRGTLQKLTRKLAQSQRAHKRLMTDVKCEIKKRTSG